jgi:acylphosphatase
MSETAERVLFSGRVQGVGFRWSTDRMARNFRVTGFVRNLSNGQVELQVQGPLGEVNGLIAAVCDHFSENITAIERENLPEHAEFSDFRVRR